MAFDIEKKIVLVSGGAGDIGGAIVEAFVKEGCRVIIGDLNLQAADEMKARLGGDVSTVEVDITSQASVEAAVKTVEERYGSLDVLVNVAGILCRKSVMDTEKEDFEKSMAINVIGTFVLSKGCATL